MKFLFYISFIALLALPLYAQESGQAESLDSLTEKEFDEFINRMQKVYDETKSLSASFEQQYKSAIGRKSASKGKVVFKKPGKMRWSYTEPTPKEFISGGGKLYIVDHSEKTVFRGEFQESVIPAGVTFLWGEGDLRKSFEIKHFPETPPSAETVRMDLTPKEGKSHLKRLILKVNKKTYRISEALIVDPAENKNYIKFTSIVENKETPESLFEFKIPKDYQTLESPKIN